MNIYIAGPLFNEMEIRRNQEVSDLLECEGFKTYLPQRDGGLFYDLKKKGYSIDTIKSQIFEYDYNAILECDAILCLLDGSVLDSGMCIELGIAFANKKHCIGYKTDYRSQDTYGNNIMVDGTLEHVFNSKNAILNHLKKFSSSLVAID